MAVVQVEAPDWEWVLSVWVAGVECGSEEATYDPSVLQWDHVVDIQVRSGCPGGTVVGALP